MVPKGPVSAGAGAVKQQIVSELVEQLCMCINSNEQYSWCLLQIPANMAKKGPLPHPKLDKTLALVLHHIDSLDENGEVRADSTRIMVSSTYSQ